MNDNTKAKLKEAIRLLKECDDGSTMFDAIWKCIYTISAELKGTIDPKQ